MAQIPQLPPADWAPVPESVLRIPDMSMLEKDLLAPPCISGDVWGRLRDNDDRVRRGFPQGGKTF